MPHFRITWHDVIAIALLMLSFILVLAVVGKVLYGQTAQVYILANDDAQKVSTAWIKLQVAETDWKTAKKEIEQKYHVEWASGFEFSNDFKAIVPARAVGAGTALLPVGKSTY